MKAKSIENKPVANQKLSKTHLLKEYAGEVLFFFFQVFSFTFNFEVQHPHRTIYQVMCSFVYTTRLASRTRFYPSHSELLYRYTVQDHAPEYRNVPREGAGDVPIFWRMILYCIFQVFSFTFNFEFQHPHRTIYQVMCSFVYTTRLASRTRFYPSHSELLYRYTVVQDHAPEYRNVPRTLVQIVLSRMPWRR